MVVVFRKGGGSRLKRLEEGQGQGEDRGVA